MSKPCKACLILVTVVLLQFISVTPAYAYIGPGAGFAFLGSTAVLLVTLILAVLTIALWPITFLWRLAAGKGIGKNARARRVVIIGLDGLEPKLTEKFIDEGRLPNLARLKEEGSYSRLGTTLPALSPVAWSTFQTGVNPGAHNIFDFLTRDKRFCLPQLASTETVTKPRKVGVGPFAITTKKSQIILTRKSQPFWKILARKGITSHVLRVPISYPPEKFAGNILSAMCTPDLKGTQGSFSFFTSSPRNSGQHTGGVFSELTAEGDIYTFKLEGPPDPRKKESIGYLTIDGSIKSTGPDSAEVNLAGQQLSLKVGNYSPWIEVDFLLGRKKISGLIRLLLRESSPHLSLYVSPVNIHPERPALPIAAPVLFSQWIARKIGLFGTLGLMEDTWGRNELALDDQSFLDQAYNAHEEREKMFFETLRRTRQGLCACVFDASDRIQHMFWRYLDEKHPSPRESEKFKETIPEMYQRMDALIGKVRNVLNPKDVLIVLSDHGFASFRRGLNLNSWLLKEGYLALKGDKNSGKDYFQDVDWARTEAFACGLTGIYLNRAGREQGGIVSEDRAEVLKREITQKLQALRDPIGDAVPVKKVYEAAKVYKGLYVDEAPDLIVGYAPGYRVSWESVTGMIEPEIFSDNCKAWSGDHHVDPKEIPGILFSNLPLRKEQPRIIDLAPSVLDMFGIAAPAYMEGSVIL